VHPSNIFLVLDLFKSPPEYRGIITLYGAKIMWKIPTCFPSTDLPS